MSGIFFQHRHVCQSIRGALLNWKESDWWHLAEENNCTAAETKEYFLDRLAEGKRVLPIGEPCEGFDYQKGCPGHSAPLADPSPASDQATVAYVNNTQGGNHVRK